MSTAEGGRGSASLISVAARSIPSLTPWLGYGLSGAALFALLMSVESRIRSAPASPTALVLLLAVPTLLVTPSWVHGAGWLPVAWWFVAAQSDSAAHRANIARGLAAASFALASLPVVWTFGSPTAYQASGSLTASVLMTVLAVWMNERCTQTAPE